MLPNPFMACRPADKTRPVKPVNKRADHRNPYVGIVLFFIAYGFSGFPVFNSGRPYAQMVAMMALYQFRKNEYRQSSIYYQTFRIRCFFTH